MTKLELLLSSVFVTLIVLLIFVVFFVAPKPTIPPKPLVIGTYQATQMEEGMVYQYDTTTGHGYLILPEYSVDLGTPQEPIMNMKPRKAKFDNLPEKDLNFDALRTHYANRKN